MGCVCWVRRQQAEAARHCAAQCDAHGGARAAALRPRAHAAAWAAHARRPGRGLPHQRAAGCCPRCMLANLSLLLETDWLASSTSWTCRMGIVFLWCLLPNLRDQRGTERT